MARLVNVLKGISGKFMLTLGTEHAKLLPKYWHIKRVWVKRKFIPNNTGVPISSQYEIVATNYNPDTVIRRISDKALHRERRKVFVYHKPRGARRGRGRRPRRSRVTPSVSLSRAR